MYGCLYSFVFKLKILDTVMDVDIVILKIKVLMQQTEKRSSLTLFDSVW